MDFRIGQFRSFLVLANTLNYAKAARMLYMSQPTLTAQIKSLEENFQVRLFERSRKGVAITAAGKELATTARALLDQLEQAGTRMKQAEMSRPVRICCSQAGQFEVLPQLLRSMAENHPEIPIEILAMVPGERLEALRSRRVDLLMMTLPVYNDDVVFEPLCSEAMIAVVPDRQPFSSMKDISVAEFARAPLLTVSEKECSRCTANALAALDRHGVTPVHLVEGPIDHNARMAMVAGGRAVAMAGESSSLAGFPGVRQLPFREQVQGSQLGMGWRNETVSENLQVVLEELRRLTVSRREIPIPIFRPDNFLERISA
ncbi:LysR family transcriptional regulator [Terriglobus tenax]|uniref:LysR substrate-binding domain-containing protein n=1 Tax=Terriglobus tenax TaxID=1111115 RepID=UPI0021E03217|nr:LysR family transcriptional regulator [Terriglobus tenax]